MKKKILFYLWSFSLGGGAEKILSTIVNNIDLSKYEVDILEIEHFDKGYEKVPTGVRILKPWQSYKQSRIKRALLWRIRKFFPNLVRNLMIKDIYDIEISFTIINPPFPFSHRNGVKKIAWIHGSIEDFRKDDWKLKKHREFLKNSEKIVSVSEKTRDSIIKLYPEFEDKTIIVYNGYNFEEIIEKSKEDAEIEIENNSIVTIGRIEDLKGSLEVYNTFKILINDLNKNYHLYYIGTGDLHKSIELQAKKDKLEKNIHFLGYQKNPYKFIKKMNVIFSMSKQEGFSGAIVEGISLGIPFVSTNVGGITELSNNGKFGKIINSEQEAANQIINYIECKNNYDRNEMYDYISKFTVDEQIRKVNDLLEMGE